MTLSNLTHYRYSDTKYNIWVYMYMYMMYMYIFRTVKIVAGFQYAKGAF